MFGVIAFTEFWLLYEGHTFPSSVFWLYVIISMLTYDCYIIVLQAAE
jgi:hypothetical protein